MRFSLNPIQAFLQSEAKGGFVLIAAALLAFFVAASPLGNLYSEALRFPLKLQVGELVFKTSPLHLVNDLLMAVFFLQVGLEIKRELVQGELRGLRKAMLPLAAAAGGMLIPALIYLGFNQQGVGTRGFGIPMATDIAFSLGVLSLLGKRVPFGMKVFLVSLAIVDDLGAVLIIALFYSTNLNLGALALAASAWGIALLVGRLRVVQLWPYLALGAVAWYFTLASGIHPTVAGVALAFAIPLLPPVRPATRLLTARLEPAQGSEQAPEAEGVARPDSPLERLEHLLNPWVAFGILPLFAFFNAGVSLEAFQLGAITYGAFWGLLAGKPLGIWLATWVAVRTGLANLPSGVGWGHVLGASLLGGIGFTMSLFVATLAFGEGPLLNQAKVGVLSASVVSALAGLAVTFQVTKIRG